MAQNPNGKGGGSNTRYKKEYCDMVIEHMSKGFSFGSFGSEVSCSRKTLDIWAEKNPEFMDAKLQGHEKAKKYYESIAKMKMLGIENEHFSAKRSDTALIIFFLKTRFRDEYSEKIELLQTIISNLSKKDLKRLTNEELDQKIKSRLAH